MPYLLPSVAAAPPDKEETHVFALAQGGVRAGSRVLISGDDASGKTSTYLTVLRETAAQYQYSASAQASVIASSSVDMVSALAADTVGFAFTAFVEDQEALTAFLLDEPAFRDDLVEICDHEPSELAANLERIVEMQIAMPRTRFLVLDCVDFEDAFWTTPVARRLFDPADRGSTSVAALRALTVFVVVVRVAPLLAQAPWLAGAFDYFMALRVGAEAALPLSDAEQREEERATLLRLMMMPDTAGAQAAAQAAAQAQHGRTGGVDDAWVSARQGQVFLEALALVTAQHARALVCVNQGGTRRALRHFVASPVVQT
jgi:hypothetical protein